MTDDCEAIRIERDKWRDLAEEYYLLDPDCGCHLCDRMREMMNSGDR